MKLTKQKLYQLILQEMTRDQKVYQDMKKRNHPEQELIGQTKLSDKYGLNLNPLSSKYDLETSEMETFPFPTDKFTHGKESGLRLEPGGGSSESITYKMHQAAKDFIEYLDVVEGLYAIDDDSFQNEDYLKSFGLHPVGGKEKEKLVRAYANQIDLGLYDDNLEKEKEMMLKKYN